MTSRGARDDEKMWGDKKSIPQSNSYFFDIIITFYHRKYILFTQITIVGIAKEEENWDENMFDLEYAFWRDEIFTSATEIDWKFLRAFHMSYDIYRFSRNTFCQKSESESEGIPMLIPKWQKTRMVATSMTFQSDDNENWAEVRVTLIHISPEM